MQEVSASPSALAFSALSARSSDFDSTQQRFNQSICGSWSSAFSDAVQRSCGDYLDAIQTCTVTSLPPQVRVSIAVDLSVCMKQVYVYIPTMARNVCSRRGSFYSSFSCNSGGSASIRMGFLASTGTAGLDGNFRAGQHPARSVYKSPICNYPSFLPVREACKSHSITAKLKVHRFLKMLRKL